MASIKSREFQPVLKPSEVPADIQRLIRGNMADYAAASNYYAKLADLAQNRVGEWMQPRGKRSFQLKSDFADHFRLMLRHKLAQSRQSMATDGNGPKTAADWVAYGLWNAAWNYKRYDENQARVRRDEVWPPGLPVTEAWQRLGEMSAPGTGYGIYEWTSYELRLPRTLFEHPRIKISESFSPDKSQLPRLTIEFTGEPVALLYRARYELPDLKERRRVRTQASS